MRFILGLIVIFGVIGLLLFGDISDGLKGVVIGGLIGFAGTYFQARTSNYFNIQKHGDEVLSLFWRYQDICDKYDISNEDLDEKVTPFISMTNGSADKESKIYKFSEKNYYDALDINKRLGDEKQLVRERIYSKAFIYFPKTEKLFREYTTLEVEYYLQKGKKDSSLSSGRLDFLKNKESDIQKNLLIEIKSHKSFFT